MDTHRVWAQRETTVEKEQTGWRGAERETGEGKGHKQVEKSTGSQREKERPIKRKKGKNDGAGKEWRREKKRTSKIEVRIRVADSAKSCLNETRRC